MGQNRFWIGGETDPPDSRPWLVADDGSPYLCCKCPCVSYYCVLAFKIIPLSGEQHDVYEWCQQYVAESPMGVSTTNSVMLDDVIGFSAYSPNVGMSIDPSAGLYEECGRTTFYIEEVHMGVLTEYWYEVRAYKISAMYPCYDEFWSECFGHCTNLPCDEWDEQWNCTHHYIPDGTYVFDGTKRPYWGRTSNAFGSYGCNTYWYNLAISRLIPYYDIAWQNKKLNAHIQKDAVDCLESETVVDDWSGDTFERCLRWGHYGASCDINGVTNYYNLWWDETGTQPERTTANNVAWLGGALSSIIPTIQAARATSVTTWADMSSSTSTSLICSQWSALSSVGCSNVAYMEIGEKDWTWQTGSFTLTKPATAPAEATGVKLYIKQTVRTYDGTYDPQTYMPVYTETVYTETRDVTFGVREYLRTADALPITASAEACYSGTHSPACITPCADLPHEEITYDIAGIEYLFSSSSSSSSAQGQ